MTRMTRALARFLTRESGAVAVEYGVLLAVIGLAVITGATIYSKELIGLIWYVVTEVSKVL